MAREESLATEPGGLFPRLQQRYGLGQDPLAMDQPFFGGAHRQHGLETLRHLAGFGDMALLVTGERGCGKTRMLAELVRSESDKLIFHRLQSQELTSEQALATRLMAIAHKALDDGQSARDAVFSFFKWSEAATRKGRRLVLLLDDADHVPATVLRILLGAHRNADTAYCAVPVLAGAEQILDLIGGIDPADPAQALVHRIDLRPLSLNELADYLTPRLTQAGGDVSQLLSRPRLQQLHTLSQGSLGRLKRIAPAVWLELAGASPRPRRERKAISKHQILWPVLAVALLAVSWVVVSWQYDATSGNSPESAANKAADQPPVVERKTIRLGPGQDQNGTVTTEPARPALSSADSVSPAPFSSTTDSARQESSPVGQASENPSAVATAPPDSVLKSSQAKASDTERANGNRENRAKSMPVAEPSVVPVAGPETRSGAKMKSSSIAQPGNATETEAAEDQAASMRVTPAETSVTPEHKHKPQPHAEAAKGFQPARPTRFVPVSSVRKRSGFTAQYVAGYEEKTAVTVLDQFPDVDGLLYTRSIHKGKPWYVVFYGQFASRSGADQAIQARRGTLDGLADRDRWVRSYAGF